MWPIPTRDYRHVRGKIKLTNQPLVSVIVPVYNRAGIVSRSLASLCRQTYGNLEIIVVDDCSTDDLEEVISQIGDARIRLIRRDVNGGAGAARNTGISTASGDFIAFHDSDDLCVFDRIERQVSTLRSAGEDVVGVHCARLVYYCANKTDYKEMKTFLLPVPGTTPLRGNLWERSLQGNFVSVPTLLLRKGVIDRIGGFSEGLRNNEDWDFSLRLSKAGNLEFIPEPLYLTIISPPASRGPSQISFNDLYSARSYVQITGALRRQGVPERLIAHHYESAARFLLRTGRPASARRFLRRGLTRSDRRIRLLGLFLFSWTPWLYRAVRRRRLARL